MKDVLLSAQSLRDWESLPRFAQNQAETKLLNCLDQGTLIPSLQAHKARFGQEIWIGYVSVESGGYRMLFKLQKDGTLYVERLVSHAVMDRILGKF